MKGLVLQNHQPDSGLEKKGEPWTLTLCLGLGLDDIGKSDLFQDLIDA